MKCKALTKKRNAMDATDHASIQCENQIAFNTSRGNSNSMIGFDNSLLSRIERNIDNQATPRPLRTAHSSLRLV